MSSAAPLKLPHVIIEHIEVDFPKDGWCAIEYDNIARIVGPSNLIVTNVSEEHKQALPASFKGCAAMTGRSLTTFLDAPPAGDSSAGATAAAAGAASTATSATVDDADMPAVLSNIRSAARVAAGAEECRICFLDARATKELEPKDAGAFDYFIVGGILGDHPPRDRGGYLRKYTFAIRHLGSRQMSTDTAVLTAFTIFRHGARLSALRFLDDPEVYKDEIDRATSSSSSGATSSSGAASSSGYRESTRIRMRYMSAWQPGLAALPDRTACASTSSASSVSPASSASSAAAGGAAAVASGGPATTLWGPSSLVPPAGAAAQHTHSSSTSTATSLQEKVGVGLPGELPAMTPGLLAHVFASMDDPLDGVLELAEDQEFDAADRRVMEAMFACD